MQARVTLARAVYSSADILLLDDVSWFVMLSKNEHLSLLFRFLLHWMYIPLAGSLTNVFEEISCVAVRSFWWYVNPSFETH